MKDESEDNKPAAVTKVTAFVLESFDLLKAAKDDARLNGGAKIISQLQNNENQKDVHYVVKRLVRSLGANVPDMRTGYFATLVALLTKFEQITVKDLLELVKKELHANGSSKSEVGDVALGQILVCGAIFRSGLILKCSSEEQTEVIQLLLNASKKKSYLSTVAHLIFLDFVKVLDVENFTTIVWSNIKQDFKKELSEHTLDSLYFLMVIHKKFPEVVKLRKLIGNSDILCEDNLQPICEKLLAGIDFNSLGHPIYSEIGAQIAKSPHLQLFWSTGIDSQLTKHNRNRELVAVNILTTIFNNIESNHEVIPELISRNFFKLFMDWFKGLQTASKIRNKKDNEDDNKLMIKKQKELLNALSKALKSDKVSSKTRVEVLKKLLFNPGEMNFTEITGTSVVKIIISDLDVDGVKKMAKLLKGVLLNSSKKFIKEGSERIWYNNERVKSAELLSYLVSHEVVKDDTEFKLTYMKLLMCFGFFKIGGDENIAVSSDLSGAIKSCFYRCFTSRFSNVDNLVTVLSSLSDFIRSLLEKEQVRSKLEKQFPEENMECWKMLMEVCSNIEENTSKSKVENVFLILLYQLGLFLFSEPSHVKIATSSIKELKSCYEHYKKGKKKKKAVKDDEEPEWIEVLVEVLLSILSADSSVLRSVVQCVFRLLWEYLTPSAVGQIVSVLDPESESNPLTQESESENEGSDDEQENDEEKSESDSEDDDDDNEDEDEQMKTPEQLRMAVQKALGSAALGSDTESIDADMLDEEEGKKLDEALAEAFKQFHQGKGKKNKKERKDKKTLSDFRIRVLDLIDIYLEKDPSMDICLAMIAPLTRCLEFCLQDNQLGELENRVRKTIKNLTKIRKFSSIDDVTEEILSDFLKSVMEKGERSHFMYQALGDVVTFFVTFIIHCSQKLDSKGTKSPKKIKKSPILDLLKEATKNYFQNRSCLLPIILFHNVLQMEWDGIFELAPIVIENVFNSEVRQFRRNEGLDLLAGLYRGLKRNKPSTETALSGLIKFEKKFDSTLRNTLKGQQEFPVKNNFFVSLKKLINTMKLFHESCHVESQIDFNSLLEIVGSCKGTVKSNENNKKQDVGNNQNIANGENTGKQSNKKTKKKKRKLEQQMNGHAEPQGKKKRKVSETSD